MSMTLDELREWHARRAGWNEPGTKIPNIWEPTTQATYAEIAAKAWWKVDENFKFVATNHHFPATLDGADASFPKGWEWGRTPPRGDWCAVSLERGITEQTAYTGDKPRDLYELSKLAWEQEAAR